MEAKMAEHCCSCGRPVSLREAMEHVKAQGEEFIRRHRDTRKLRRMVIKPFNLDSAVAVYCSSCGALEIDRWGCPDCIPERKMTPTQQERDDAAEAHVIAQIGRERYDADMADAATEDGMG